MTFRTRHQLPLLRYLWVPVAVLLVLAGCARNEGEDSSFGGGIGGTGTGTIDRIQLMVSPNGATNQGNGSNQDPVVVMGETRHFTITPDTEVLMDGDPLVLEGLVDDGTGWVASLVVDKDANTSFTRGTALKMHIRHTLIGPVTSEAPDLEVLGQPVHPAGSTVVTSTTQTTLLRTRHWGVGSTRVLLVSGYPDPENQVQATRLDDGTGYEGPWLLTGPVSEVDPGRSFKIRQQQVGLWGVRVEECAGGIQPGDWVEVRADPIPDFMPSLPLNSATVVRCVRQGLAFPGDSLDEPVAAELEGRVYEIIPTGFVLGGQWVETGEETLYTGGTARDVVRGQLLRVSGLFIPLTDTLHALKVRVLTTGG